ncbi:MAG: helix-turn-helix domain-containing protein [Anaerolineales bacterium]|nr:helix-turn-helix domain-containing protein [Anaerolineales bacterium]
MGLTSVEAAKVLGITPTQVTRLCKLGTIKARKHGPVWDIDPASVEAYKKAPRNKGGRPKK